MYIKQLSKALLLCFAITLLAVPLQIKQVTSQNSTQTKIAIAPSTLQVGQEGKNLTEVNPFSLNITVSNVTDLFAWQITSYLDPRIINCTDVTLPTGHVFDGKNFYEVTKKIETWLQLLKNNTKIDLTNPVGTSWTVEKRGEVNSPETPKGIVQNNITEWFDRDGSGSLSTSDIVTLSSKPTFIEKYYVSKIYWEGSFIKLEVSVAVVQHGATLLGGESTFSGDGVLCQLTFKPLRPGTCMLNVSASTELTILLDSNRTDIPFSVEHATINVIGIPAVKDPSTITINVPANAKVDSEITITGSLSPLKEGVTVKIYYKPPGGDWQLLTEVQTDEQGNYRHVVTLDQIGNYVFYSQWDGDDETYGSKSEEKTVAVTETGEVPGGFNIGDYLLYIIVAVVVIIIIAVVVYFVKSRKT